MDKASMISSEKEVRKTADDGKRTALSIVAADHDEGGEFLKGLYLWDDVEYLDVYAEWILDEIIPKGAIITLIAPGGVGKSYLCERLGRDISLGLSFAGLKTRRTPVYYVDFENPLAVVKDRRKKIGGSNNMYLWHVSSNPAPPKLDEPNWKLYKRLPPGLIFIDTLRSSHSREENSSTEMEPIMDRLRKLREYGHTIVILHHTAKRSDGSKGSSVITDLADHILSLERISGGDMDTNAVYRFGCRFKTRFKPGHIFLSFSPERGFEPREDPDISIMSRIRDAIIRESGGRGMNQTDIVETMESTLNDLKDKKIRDLLKKGVGRFWSFKKGPKNASLYTPLLPSDHDGTESPRRHSLPTVETDRQTSDGQEAAANFEKIVKHYVHQGLSTEEARMMAREEV